MRPPDMAEKSKDPKKKSVKDATPRHQPSGRPARVLLPDKGSAPRSAYQVRKKPRQQRSKQMVHAILQAAAELFAQLGYARATTNKIADRAGVSVGSLYQYFPNKDSILAGLLAQHHAEVHEVVGAALSRLADPATPLADGLRQLLTELVALHQANPALTRALSAAVLRESPAADDPHKDDGGAQARRVSILLAARPDVRDGDYVAMAAVLGQTTTQLTRWLVHDTPPGMDQSALLEEALRLLLRYLEK